MNADRCTATAKSSQERCKRTAPPGSTVCRAHGGAAPQVARKAAEREVERQALAQLSRHGYAPVADPLTALAELAGEVLAVKNIFRERLAALSEDAWRRTDDHGAEQLRAEVALYERALDRSARVLADIARLRIDERLTAITEEQARTMVAILTAVLERLDLTEQAGQVRELVAVELDKLGEAG